MNLEDVIDNKYGLLQDDWSLAGQKFGEDGQLQIVGWSGKNKSGNKFYIGKCRICMGDFELHGEGYFRCNKGNLLSGKLPCGCTRLKMSKEQYSTLCIRKANEMGYSFLGFMGKWSGKKTKIRLFCKSTVNGLVTQSIK